MTGDGTGQSAEAFLQWAAGAWVAAPIPASDAIGLAGGAAAALTAVGAVPEAIAQEWVEDFKHRIQELRQAGTAPASAAPQTAEAAPREAFPMSAVLAGSAAGWRVLSIELWPDGELVLRLVTLSSDADWPRQLLDSISFSTASGDSIRSADGQLSMRADGVVLGELKFSVAASQVSDGLLLHAGETVHELTWLPNSPEDGSAP